MDHVNRHTPDLHLAAAVQFQGRIVRMGCLESQATAVALDEFGRSAERVAERADDLRRSAPQRVGLAPRWWTRQRSIGR